MLRLSQPQPFGTDRFVCASSAGLVIVGPGRYQETMIDHPRKYAVTSPYPIGDNKILCAATIKQFTDPDTGEILGQTSEPSLGQIRVFEVHERFSVAKAVKGDSSPFRRGMTCRPLPAPHRRARTTSRGY